MAANPLKILNTLHVSGSSFFTEDVTLSDKKVKGVAAGTATTDAVNFGQLSSETSRAGSVEASLSTGISAEASRAGSVEASLSTGLSAEASRAGSVEASLSTGLSAEASRAASAEASVSAAASTAVSAEASRAGSVEASLSTGLSAEASRAGSVEASLSTGLSAEVSRAGSVEASLSTGISAEASRAASAEASVSAAASTAVSAEASRAGSAEASLSTGLSTEVSRAGSAEASLSTGISAEVSRAGSAEASLSTGLSAEASRAASAEASVSAAASTAVSAEASRAGSVEASLSTGLSSEVSRAGSVEVSLSTGLSTEVSRAGSVEASLSTALSNEVSRATSVESSIATNFLKLDGTSTMTGELKMGNQDIVNANNGTFNGDLLVKGNLNVSGALAYINTTNLDVTDAKVTIAKGAANLASAADAGFYVGSDTAPLAKAYVHTDGEWAISGSKGLAIALTGSNDVGFFELNANNEFNVEKTLRTMGGMFSSGIDDMNARYNDARIAVEVTLNGNGEGTYTFNTLPFHKDEMAKIAVDVMVSGAAGYTNDLVSVHMKAVGNYASLEITAPAAADGKVRIIAVNEKWALQ